MQHIPMVSVRSVIPHFYRARERRTYASEDRLSIGNGINEPSPMPPAAGALYLVLEKTCRNQPVPGNKKSPLFNEPINRKR